ncbi:MFS transporter [Nocardia bhagyanarayanae]|uniref:Putative MFS family arabinose efflux permease n=1 Tax=Nocardia bhagyanarayanae TaxID=1215925 RepID=A0A543FGL7_9NOCA|nr:MFS transporter [Nocardia bhagyanarayanae]TQM32931.1 putative MFS family arabinose efflux permease [Nocardia bhagyanarayanae]
MATGVTRSQRFVLALVCAVAVSTIYAIQPVLEAAGAGLGLARESLGWLVAAGQIGYCAGLVLLVPLGDVVNRRRLITVHLVLTAAGAAVAAAAPNAAVAVAGLAVAGLFAVVVQVTVAYVAAVSAPSERGRNIGAVTSGVVIGILGVRVLAGVLGDTVGWRAVYALLAVLCVALARTVHATLDPDREVTGARYGHVLASMGRLARTDRLLTSRGLIAFFLFASFGTLWSGLALPLGAEPWNFGTTQIGLFGVAGLAGALGAARAGRWADSGRAQAITGSALALLTASWLLTARIETTLVPLVIGIIVLDFAVQAVHVSSQHLLTTAHPDRASSVIGAYMACYSLGSALGAITTTWAYSTWGWSASCWTGAAYSLVALVLWGLAQVADSTGRDAASSPEPPSPVGRTCDAPLHQPDQDEHHGDDDEDRDGKVGCGHPARGRRIGG